jgi:hypothetical protein
VASQDASAVIDVTKLISLAALDAIGRTAFAYEFHAVAGGDNELRKSFHNIPHLTFGNPSDLAILGQGIAARIPITLMWFLYDNLPLEALKRVHRFTALATRVSRELVADKAEELLAGKDKRDIMSLLGSSPHFFVYIYKFMPNVFDHSESKRVLECPNQAH